MSRRLFCHTFLIFTLLFSTLPFTAQAQNAEVSAVERKAILNALRVPVEKSLKKKVLFKVDQLKMEDGWAFLRGVPQMPDGRPMNYRGTTYQKLIDLGAFDDSVTALLRKKGARWTVVTYNIGATDVVWVDWAEKYKAPASLFE